VASRLRRLGPIRSVASAAPFLGSLVKGAGNPAASIAGAAAATVGHCAGGAKDGREPEIAHC
jgi:hypothetical protein